MDALNSADLLLLGTFCFDQRSCALFHLDSGAHIQIGSRALGVLGGLVQHAGDLLPKHEFLKAVWPVPLVEYAKLTVQATRTSFPRRPLVAVALAGLLIMAGGLLLRSFQMMPSAMPATPVAAAGLPAQRLSIVVLPFANLSDDREQQHFTVGITADLTTDMSLIPGSLVIS